MRQAATRSSAAVGFIGLLAALTARGKFGSNVFLPSLFAIARELHGFVKVTPPDHGRIKTRRIWCSTALNTYIDFPHVDQVFMIERESIENKPQRARVLSLWESRVEPAIDLAATPAVRQPRSLEYFATAR